MTACSLPLEVQGPLLPEMPRVFVGFPAKIKRFIEKALQRLHAMNNIATGSRNSMCDALVDDIDAGTTDATGDLNIYTAAFATLLAELTFANPAFGAAAAGVATANAITGDSSANATGTAAVARWRDRDNATVFEGTVGTAGADINFNTVSFTTGDAVDVTSMTVTMPGS